MSDLPLSDQAKLKIGEAIIRYQRFENLLKKLIPLVQITSKKGDTPEKINEQFSVTDMQTMGGLIKRLYKEIYSVEGVDPEPLHPEGATLAIHFRLPLLSEQERDEKERLFTGLLKYRNDLIHTRLLNFDPSNDAACQQLIDELETQMEVLKPLHKELIDALLYFTDIVQTFRDHPEILYGKSPESLRIGEHHFKKES